MVGRPTLHRRAWVCNAEILSFCLCFVCRFFGRMLFLFSLDGSSSFGPNRHPPSDGTRITTWLRLSHSRVFGYAGGRVGRAALWASRESGVFVRVRVRILAVNPTSAVAIEVGDVS